LWSARAPTALLVSLVTGTQASGTPCCRLAAPLPPYLRQGAASEAAAGDAVMISPMGVVLAWGRRQCHSGQRRRGGVVVRMEREGMSG
jgi:hypothetical protein